MGRTPYSRPSISRETLSFLSLFRQVHRRRLHHEILGFASADDRVEVESEEGDVVGFGGCGIFNMKACCKYCVYCKDCNDPNICPGNPNCKYCNKCFLCRKLC